MSRISAITIKQPPEVLDPAGLEDLLRTLRLYHDRNRELEEAVSKKEQKVEDISRNRRALDETKIRLEERADVCVLCICWQSS